MKTLTFIPCPRSFTLDFDEWYSHKKGDFKTEADAEKQWEAMCDNADNEITLDEWNDLDWDDVEEKCDELQEEYKTDYYDYDMSALIDKVEEDFKAIGVEFKRDWSCCISCGHSELEKVENYVFYHGQDTDWLRKGYTDLHLAFRFDDDTRKKVLEMIEKQPIGEQYLHWSGSDDTKIYLTSDVDLMAKHIIEDAKRQEWIDKCKAERIANETQMANEKKARREELLKQLAELDK
jgi:hypothetical protein